MKAETHPKYDPIKATCSCGNVIETKSTICNDISIEVCSQCHPFYTGKQKRSIQLVELIALISGSVEAAAAAKARWAFPLTVRCKGVLQTHRLSQLHLILPEARSRLGKELW